MISTLHLFEAVAKEQTQQEEVDPGDYILLRAQQMMQIRAQEAAAEEELAAAEKQAQLDAEEENEVVRQVDEQKSKQRISAKVQEQLNNDPEFHKTQAADKIHKEQLDASVKSILGGKTPVKRVDLDGEDNEPSSNESVENENSKEIQEEQPVQEGWYL